MDACYGKNTFVFLFVFFSLLFRYQTVRGNGRITFNQSRIDVRTQEPTAIVRVSLCVYATLCVWCICLNWLANFKTCESKAPTHCRKNWRLPLTSKTPWKWRTDSTIPMLLALPVTVQRVFRVVCVCVVPPESVTPFGKWALNTPELQFSTYA